MATPLVIVLSMVTVGIYLPIWFLIQRRAINELPSPGKVGATLPLVALVLFCISTLMMPLHLLEILPPDEARDMTIRAVENLVNISGSVLVILLAFKVRQILVDHFGRQLGLPPQLSGIATFFFTIFYLQYKINVLPAPAMYQRSTSHKKKTPSTL